MSVPAGATDPTARPSTARGIVLAVLCAAFAGSAIVAGKPGVARCPPLAFAFWTTLFGTAFTGLRLAALPAGGRRPTRRAWPLLLGHAALSFVSIWAFWAGIDRLHPAVAGFLGRSETLVSIAGGVLLLGERLRAAELLGAAVAVAGIVLLHAPAALAADAPARGGHGLVLLGASCFGAAEILTKLAARHTRPETFVFWRGLVLVPAFALVALLRGALARPDGVLLLSAGAVALLAPTLARLTWMHALRTLDLAKAAVVGQLQPVFTLVVALAAFGTLPRPLELAGGGLVLAGVLLLAHAAARASRPGRAATAALPPADVL